MPQRPANLRDAFHQETFKRVTKTRPLVRLYRAPETALKEIPLSGTGVKAGEKLVWWFDPNDLVSRSERELLRAFHAVLKRLREIRGAATLPKKEALEVYRLQQQGLTIAQIADQFKSRWPNCTDIESRERRVKRYLRQVRARLAEAEKREAAGLTARQRAILATVREDPVD